MTEIKYIQHEKKVAAIWKNLSVWLMMAFMAWWLWPFSAALPLKTSKRVLPSGWQHFCKGDQIRALALDGENLWVGGLDGLKRFNWHTAQDTSLGIATPPNKLVRIESLLVDPSRNLWIAHERGLACLDRNGVWYDQTSFLPDPKCLALCWSKQGELWVGTWRGVAVRSSLGKWRQYNLCDGLPGERIRAIAADSDGGIWIGSYDAPGGGLLHWSGNIKRYYTTDNLLAHPNVAAIFEDSQGRMWIGTGFFDRGGVTLYPDWKRGDLSTARIMRQSDGLAGNKGRSFCEDRDGNIWIGSELDGLTRLSKDGKIKIIKESDGLIGNEIMCMVQDPDGNLWLGQENGLCRIEASALANIR